MNVFLNRCKVVFAEEKSKANLSIYVSNYILIIQKLKEVFMREDLYSAAEPGKKKPPKTSGANNRGTGRLGVGEKQTKKLFKEKEK